MRNDHESDNEAENNPTECGEHYKKPTVDVDKAKTQAENDASTMPHTKLTNLSDNKSRDHEESDNDYAYFNLNTPGNPIQVTTSSTQVNVTTLLDEDVLLMEEQVAHLAEIQQQTAGWDKTQFLEEIFILRNRIIRLEDRTLEHHNGPTNLARETSSTLTSSQEPQMPQQDQ
jgi:hypothetical protein